MASRDEGRKEDIIRGRREVRLNSLIYVMSMLYQITSYLDTPREDEKEWHCKGILLLKQTEKQ